MARPRQRRAIATASNFECHEPTSGEIQGNCSLSSGHSAQCYTDVTLRRTPIVALIAALALESSLSPVAGAQGALPAKPISAPLPQPEHVKLSNDSPGLIEPTLVNAEGRIATNRECKGSDQDGTVKFSFVVDLNGHPRNVIFEQALENEIDLLALKIMLRSQFNPAMLNGAPVPVGREVEMRLRACAEIERDQSGQAIQRLHLRFPPDEKFKDWKQGQAEANLAPLLMPSGVYVDAEPVGGTFSQPKSLALPQPAALQGPRTFSLSVRMLVDEHGMPQDLQVLKCSDPAQSPQFVQTLRRMRFQPAMRDGMPVPAHIEQSITVTPG